MFEYYSDRKIDKKRKEDLFVIFWESCLFRWYNGDFMFLFLNVFWGLEMGFFEFKMFVVNKLLCLLEFNSFFLCEGKVKGEFIFEFDSFF